MLRFCGGWAGWTSAQALNEDLNYVAAAYAGYAETLETIFGSSDEEKDKKMPKVTKDARGEPIVLSPAVFDTQFGDGKFQLRKK